MTVAQLDHYVGYLKKHGFLDCTVIDEQIHVNLFINNYKVLRDIRKKVTYTNLSSSIYEFLNSTSILI